MTAIRLPVSFALALGATITMFWFLAMLIAVEPRGRRIPTVPVEIGKTHVPEPEPVRTPPVKPPIEKPKPPPDDLGIIVDRKNVNPGNDPAVLLPVGVGFGNGEVVQPPGNEIALGTSSGSDRGPVPQVRLEPEYPRSAKERGIEGWITFRFTVATDGSVKDIAILDAQPPRIWDSATLRAVSSWKYQPAIQDGRAVEQVGVTVTYRYELER
jgi:protein TonB